MSFVAKAVKKVFKVVKKVVKKTTSFIKRVVKSDWFKIAAVVALSVFTAGLASGGFAAFSGAMASAQAAGASALGSFFSAVGTTMSTGWAAITSSVTNLFGAGASTGSIGAGTQPLMTAGLEGTGGLLGTGAAAGTGAGSTAVTGLAAEAASGFVAPLASNIGTALTGTGLSSAGTAASKGILSKFGSLLMDKGVSGMMMRQGIMTGIQGYFQQKELERQEGYYKNRTVWGGPAFGGTTEPMQFLRPSADQSRAQEQATTMPMATPQEIQHADQAAAQQQQTQSALLGIPDGAPIEGEQAFAQAPIPNQPPPAQQPITGRATNRGLLDLETLGAYNA